MFRILAAAICGLSLLVPSVLARADGPTEYTLLATNKPSTMEEELNEASSKGYRFSAVMGGDTAFGGSQTVVIMQKSPSSRFEYRLLATRRTSTMQKELQQAGDQGFEYRGHTAFGGQEVVVILERDTSIESPTKYEYKLLATLKTSTMQKELERAAAEGYEFVGLTVGQTLGGNEMVAILRRPIAEPLASRGIVLQARSLGEPPAK